jgi:hypothetical protein
MLYILTILVEAYEVKQYPASPNSAAKEIYPQQ